MGRNGDEMNPNECQHEETYDDDDGAVYCNDCGVCLAVTCDRCAGHGEIAEDTMCPQCGGTGFLG